MTFATCVHYPLGYKTLCYRCPHPFEQSKVRAEVCSVCYLSRTYSPMGVRRHPDQFEIPPNTYTPLTEWQRCKEYGHPEIIIKGSDISCKACGALAAWIKPL